MLNRSQPIDPKFYGKLKLDDRDDKKKDERIIKAQFIGEMFRDILNDNRRQKPSLLTRLHWKRRRIKDTYYDIKNAIRNHIKWFRVINGLRPWEGFSGLISVMQAHLHDYLEAEEKYGISLEEYKAEKIKSVRETLEILERMKEPEEYTFKLLRLVEQKYPKYMYLITEYDGGTSYSGDFVAQGNGWTGKESGRDCREGYFEFREGKFVLADSPDIGETERLLAELRQYYEERDAGYKQAEINANEDFERLGQLLKENLYSWWD